MAEGSDGVERSVLVLAAMLYFPIDDRIAIILSPRDPVRA
jgi:hypothetical protein